MDISTVVGLLLAVVLLGLSLTTGNTGLGLFVDVPSVILVGGGTIAVTLVSFRVNDLRGLLKVMARAVFFRIPSAGEEIERIIAYANLARKEGLLALEARLQDVEDRFFSKGVQLVIDGFSAETVRDIMDLELAWQHQRHAMGKRMLDTMATMAPAFGMIGTLVGLVQMLNNMSDPSTIGAGMATALLTTFYGAVLANVIFTPLASKLDVRAKEEALLRELMIEGLVSIQSGEKPQLIKEKLKGFLPPSNREAVAL